MQKRVVVELYVKDCRDCPFRRVIRGQGECWEQCGHKDHGQKPYGNILWDCQEEFREVPTWCPLGLRVEAVDCTVTVEL